MNKKLLNYALISLMRDKISVIPVGKNKIPLIPWKEFQERFATPEEVQGWFERFDDPQIGFVTGKISNLTVVDVEKGGNWDWLPQDTTIIKTGGFGRHFYFKFEEGVNNSARIKELTDIRGSGGYVVAAGSVSDKGSYEILKDKPLLPFPKELFPEKKQDIFNVPESGRPKFISKPTKELDYYPGYGKGSRNDEVAKYIGYVLTQIPQQDWHNEGWLAVEQANNRNAPPLPQKELIATFESIKAIEVRNNPLGRSQGQYGLPAAISEPDSPVVLDEEDEVKHIADVAEEQAINQTDIYPLQIPCFDDVIKGGVCPGDVITIGGYSGHGKTSFCQDLTMSMLRGKRKAKALWFSYEVLVSHVWEKFQEMGMTKSDCAFIPAKHTTGNVAWIEAKIKEGKEKFGTKVIFIDHLGFLLPKTKGVMGKNLSSNHSVFLTQIMRDLKTIALKEEVIIFLPVHLKKPAHGSKRAEIDDISGSAGPGQESDLVFLIEREKDRSEDAKSYFTNNTKISLAKNRKTGTTVIANFNMVGGRFAYDDSSDKADALFNSIGRDPDPIEKEIDLIEKAKEKLKVEVKIDKQEDLKDLMDDAWDEFDN